jgi:hypothetical protein
MVKLKWEQVEQEKPQGWNDMSYIFRAKVPGGWLIRCMNGNSITFIPDSDHLWQLLVIIREDRQ